MADPPGFKRNIRWSGGTEMDTARYLVNPGDNTDAGSLVHIRPYLDNGQTIFIFPVGVEEFRASGDTQLGLHHYIGDNAVDGVVLHWEEGRITLAGTFPGITSHTNMVELRNILRTPPKQDKGLTLYANGVFENEQYVLPESWEFSHDRDDRSHSIDYTITLVRTGDSKRLADKPGDPPPPNPSHSTTPLGAPSRIFTIKSGARTLQAMSTITYVPLNIIVNLNQGQLNKWQKSHPKVSNVQLPFYRWPIGTKFRY